MDHGRLAAELTDTRSQEIASLPASWLRGVDLGILRFRCTMTHVGVRFGDCELSVERIELRRAGQIVDMEPQVFDVLAYLLRHRERAVPKTELLDQIWGNRFVSESALSSRIKSARRAVGDTGRDQRIIKTIYGRGYRFVADVLEKPRFDGPAHGEEAAVGPAAEDTGTPADRVLRAVGDIRAGIGAAIQVGGGPGSGKTQLLHQVAGAARRQALAVGLSAPILASSSPYLCVAEALDEMAQRDPALLDVIPATCRAELDRAFDGQLPTTRQRWFFAVREFLVAAAERSGAVLLLDDLHLAHREALILVDDIARLTHTHSLAVVITQRSGARARPGFEVADLGAGDPAPADQHVASDLPAGVAEVLRRVAQIGDRFDRLDFAAAAGDAPADQLLDQALDSGAVCAESGKYRFADPAVAARLAAEIAPALRPTVRAEIAMRLVDLGATPAQVADLLLAAGQPAVAARYALEAARIAAASALHAEVLRWTDAVRDHVDGAAEAALLSLRADALAAIGDHAAVPAYRKALAVADLDQAPSLRARLARVAMLSGDLASAEEALAGLEPSGGPDDGAILLARGMLAYFSDDLDGADAGSRSRAAY